MLTEQRYKEKCICFARIASILLPDTLTSHKTVWLKVPLTPDLISCVKPHSSDEIILAEIDIFLIDEAEMRPKYGLQNIYQLLRSGGKVILLRGYFWHCLSYEIFLSKCAFYGQFLRLLN